jgi:hypothetical protein
LAWAFPEGLQSEVRVFEGDREGVRRFAVAYALEGLAACCGSGFSRDLPRDRG